MSSKRYPEEFKIEAVKQVTKKGHSEAEIVTCLETTTHSLYAWIKRYDPSAELAKLKKSCKWLLKKGAY